MYTRCPTCSTCFRVTDRHLAIANGKVRCGQCKLVFNATEYAIDDLPVSSLTEKTPPPPAPVQKVEPATMAPTAKEKSEQTSKPIGVSKEEKNTAEKPVFDADATMIADMNSVNKNDLDNINLDLSDTETPTKEDNDLNDVFNNNVDLDAAIDQLTKSTEDAIKKNDFNIEDKESLVNVTDDYSAPKNNDADVFSTDAYHATEASNVEDILSEMEGQLSLNIPDPNQQDATEYSANNEFDFIQLDDESADSITLDKEHSETNDDTLKKHFNLDEFDILEELDNSLEDEENSLNNDVSNTKDSKEKNIDADELFNHIDISDFQDSEIDDDIQTEKTSSENSRFSNDVDEVDVPFQLRNDIEQIQTSPQRRIPPLIIFSFFILLLVLTVSQLAYFRSHQLVKAIPESRPFLVQFCEKISCQYSGPIDKKKIQLISRDVRLHPKEKKALLISAAMINNATFAQPYPKIHIRLSDISGNVIAERIFDSKTYMGKLSTPFLLMKSKTPVHINFEVVDPGKDAINFEFTFL